MMVPAPSIGNIGNANGPRAWTVSESRILRGVLRVLLTNDDGLDAEGLQTLRRALVALDDIELAVVAPDENQSATARSISIRRPLWVQEVPFDDGTVGYAADGTPVDCVRLAALGLIDGFEPDVIVSGINHGANLGDDITYSGTVAAALEGDRARHPGHRRLPAVSERGDLDHRMGRRFDFENAAAFVARVVDRLDDVPLPDGHAAQHQRARRARSAASRSRGSASASTRTGWT